MDQTTFLQAYWKDVAAQDASALRTYFHADAYINWHNTNEQFTLEEFIIANCEYPNEWEGQIERILLQEKEAITVVNVYTKDHSLSFHVTSFFSFSQNKIKAIDEYWGEDGLAPEWRLAKRIGMPIK